MVKCWTVSQGNKPCVSTILIFDGITVVMHHFMPWFWFEVAQGVISELVNSCFLNCCFKHLSCCIKYNISSSKHTRQPLHSNCIIECCFYMKTDFNVFNELGQTAPLNVNSSIGGNFFTFRCWFTALKNAIFSLELVCKIPSLVLLLTDK